MGVLFGGVRYIFLSKIYNVSLFYRLGWFCRKPYEIQNPDSMLNFSGLHNTSASQHEDAARRAASAALHASWSPRSVHRAVGVASLPAINQVLGRFDFSVDEDSGRAAASLFPNVFRQILEKHDAESLHLTFSVGRYADWRYGSAQIFNRSGLSHAPFGTRLQVALRGDADIQQRWRGITSELGGIFSASLNQMDETVVTEPLPGSSPQELGAFPSTNTDPALVFLHGSLAREELCTENLTPWLKMLPCRAVSGLGALIDPINALSGEYLSLSLFAARSQDGTWSLQQHLTTVQSPSKHNKARWSLGSLFLRTSNPRISVRARLLKKA